MRENFDTLPNAMITVFIVIIGDDWNELMVEYIRATTPGAIAYFVSLVISGNIILLQLFLALLLNNFEDQENTKQQQQNENSFAKRLKMHLTTVWDRLCQTNCCKKVSKKYHQNSISEDSDRASSK